MKTIHLDNQILLIDETAEIKYDLNKYQYYINTKTNEIHQVRPLTIGKYNKESFLIIAASPKLGDLPEFETLPPNAKEDYSKYTPINGDNVWIKVFSNWSSGTYIGLDEDKISHLVREPKEGGGYILKSKEILPYEAMPNQLPPNTEDDVEKFIRNIMNETESVDEIWQIEAEKVLQLYLQAKSETMFSLEDMNQALFIGARNHISPKKAAHLLNDYIQSLIKPKEYEFVVEMENDYEEPQGDYQRPKIVNNKIQGTWKQKN